MIVGVGLLVVAVLATMGFFVLGSSSDSGEAGRYDASADDVPSEDAADEPGQQLVADAIDEVAGGEGSADPVATTCAELDPSTWRPSPTERDLVAETRAGTVPGPFPGGKPIGAPTFTSEFPTADAFLSQSTVSDVAARAQVMADAGYAGGIGSSFTRFFSVEVLAFRDEPAATDYVTARLAELCPTLGDIPVLPLGDDGFVWVGLTGTINGNFLLGGNQVRLTVCECAPDVGIEIVQRWYEEWIEQLAAAPTAPAGSDQAESLDR